MHCVLIRLMRATLPSKRLRSGTHSFKRMLEKEKQFPANLHHANNLMLKGYMSVVYIFTMNALMYGSTYLYGMWKLCVVYKR